MKISFFYILNCREIIFSAFAKWLAKAPYSKQVTTTATKQRL